MRWSLIVAVVAVASCSSRDRTTTAVDAIAASELRVVLENAPTPRAISSGFLLVDAVAPATARGELRLSTGVAVRALDLDDVAGRASAHAITYAHAVPNGDLVFLRHPRGVEELRVLSGPSTSLRHRVSGARLEADGERVHAVRDGVRVATMEQPYVIDSAGKHALHATIDGDVIAIALPNDLHFPAIVDPLWTTTGSLLHTHVGTAAVALADGKVILAGGQEWSDPTDPTTAGPGSHAEIYDPTSATWSATTNVPTIGSFRNGVRLTSGKALLYGNFNTWIYDPVAKSWSQPSDVSANPILGFFSLVPLNDGGAFLIGSAMAGTSLRRLNSALTAWTEITYTKSRPTAVAALLPSGKVLIGGGGTSATLKTSAEIFDPATSTFTDAAPMLTPHGSGIAVTLNSGKVLVTGGGTSAAELYDEATNTWTALPSSLHMHDALPVKLTDGAVVLAGGSSGSTDVDMFDPTTLTWFDAGPLTVSRSNHGTAALPGGKMILAAGQGPGGALTSAEIFARSALGEACKSDVLCLSGHCVDGVCCDTACTETCKSCSTGTCTAVSGPPVHGTCAGGYKCSAGACLTTCSMTTDCDPASFCMGSTCAARQPLATACTADEQCQSGHCTEGVCCGSASCGAGSSCKSPGKEGNCVKLLGTACGTATECASSFCVDSVCCAAACAPYVHCPMGACASSCTTDGDCVSSSYCSGGKCIPKKSNGDGCGMSNECSSSQCIDSHCCAEMRSCAPYICASTGCKTSCSNDSECTKGNSCEDGVCAPASSACSDDGLSSIGKDGTPHPCTPYKCRPDGLCANSCTSSSECTNGAICDTASGKCQLQAAGEDSGGCSFGHGTGAGLSAAITMLLALARIRRR